MAATVLLLHELPDGTSHFDWLIQRSGGAETPLVSFRVRERIDAGGLRTFVAERLPDHRAAYLTYEGEVGGGRGRVRRVAEGDLTLVEDGAGRFAVMGRLGEARGTFQGTEDQNGMWRFAFAPDVGVVN